MENTELLPLRREMDRINREMRALYLERLEVGKRIAAVKMDQGLPIFDAAREQAIVDAMTAEVVEADRAGLERMFRLLFEESRAAQQRCMERSAANRD